MTKSNLLMFQIKQQQIVWQDDILIKIDIILDLEARCFAKKGENINNTLKWTN